MSDKKISELTEATSVAITDELVLLQGGETKRASVGTLGAGKTGWVQYADGSVIAANGQNITNGVSTTLEIDGSTSITSQQPADATVPLWDTTNHKLMPISSGDSYDVRLLFTAENYSGTSPYLTIELDIGGSQGVIAAVTVPLMKGGAAQRVMVPMPIFTLGTFLANGGEFKVTYAGNTTFDLHSASIVITRTHAAG